jgi:septal ring factor EnvC (AmiA/AmiB activator)
MTKKIFLPLLFMLISAVTVTAQPVQDKSQLENERKAIQRELNEIQGLYNKVKGQTRQTLSQLNMLNRKINLQEQYIGSINKEIRNITDDIYLSNLEIYRLQKQLDTLKAQYARTVVYAYKNRSSYDYLNFIFSSNNFNDAVRRIAYLKSYRAYREKQVNVIRQTQHLIAERQKQQIARKSQKSKAIQSHTKEVQVLAVQRKEKDQVVSQLKSKEKDLKKEIAAKKKKDRDLQNAITAIVRKEIEAAKAKAKAEADALRKAEEAKIAANKPVTTTSTTTTSENNGSTTSTTAVPASRTSTSRPESYLDLNARDVALNNKFELNKGKLPWPVDNGVVTLNFGNNKIDNTLLTFDNPGITIATPSSGVAVKAIFDGEVSGIYNLGDGMAVTIRHGKYFTTYSNLASVSVSKGATVKTGQAIGKAGKDDSGTGGQVDLILMIETRNVDPKPWLRR